MSSDVMEKSYGAAHPDWGAPFNGSPYWTPSESQLDELDSLLPSFLETAETYQQGSIKLDRYRRQYMGYTSSQKGKMIYVNAFCNKHSRSDSQLEQQFLHVDDGGICYWRVSYHVNEKKFSEFSVNGEA